MMTLEDKYAAEAGWANFSIEGDRLWCRCDKCSGPGSYDGKVEAIPDAFFVLMNNAIQPMRTILGFPFSVTSGYRCRFHPAEIKKANPGPHQVGAIDLGVTHTYADALLEKSYEFKSYITGRGVNQRGDVDTRFMHFDGLPASPWRPRPHLWSY